jgi:hypothetical protein
MYETRVIDWENLQNRILIFNIMNFFDFETVSLSKLVTLNVVSMTTSMLEFINDKWFSLSNYIMSYINDSQSFQMLNISLTC